MPSESQTGNNSSMDLGEFKRLLPQICQLAGTDKDGFFTCARGVSNPRRGIVLAAAKHITGQTFKVIGQELADAKGSTVRASVYQANKHLPGAVKRLVDDINIGLAEVPISAFLNEGESPPQVVVRNMRKHFASEQTIKSYCRTKGIPYAPQ